MDINIFSSTQEQKEKNSEVNGRECHIFILTRAILPLSLHYKQKLRNKNKNYMTLVQQILQKKKKIEYGHALKYLGFIAHIFYTAINAIK